MHNHQIQFRYLKEYTCYEIKQCFNNKSIPSQKCSIKFQGNPPRYRGDPRIKTEAIDKTLDYETLYIFKWKFDQIVTLDLFVFDEEKFIRFQMNQKPLLINISAGFLYIVGGSHIYIINLSNVESCIKEPISNDDLYSLEPAFIENQFGVILYSWNSNEGFKSRKFSPSYIEQQSNWLLKMITRKSLIQNQVKGLLKVILPNVLGLILLSSTQYCFINLTNMQILHSTKTELTGWQIQKPNKVLVKFHQNVRSHGDDDSLLVAIAERNYIQIVIVHLKYDDEKKMELGIDDDKMPLVKTLTNGYLIDWDASNAAEYMCLYIDGIILDYVMLDDGIIYYCEQSISNKIPISNFIHYLNPLIKYPILALEHNIWNQYLIDRKIQESVSDKDKQLSLNRYIVPNRYSVPFLLHSTQMYPFNQIQPQEINNKKLIIDWINCYKINRLLIFRSDIILIRQSSISTFLQIPEDQYLSEAKDKTLNKKQINNFNNDEQSFLSADSQHYQYPDDNLQKMPNQFTYERCINQQIKQLEIYQDDNPYASYMQEFQRKLRHPYDILSVYGALENKSLIFAKQLLRNRLKDTILFYTEIFTQNFTRCKSSELNAADCTDLKISKQEELIIHYLNEFSKILNEPAQQINNYGIDLFQIFINSHKFNILVDENGSQIVNIDKECWILLNRLFQDLLPNFQQISSKKQKDCAINPFVKLLVKNYKLHQNDDQEKYLLFNMFSYIFTHSPSNICLTNSVFIALHYMPIERELFMRLFNAYLLKIIHEAFRGQSMSQQQVIKQFIQNLTQAKILNRKQIDNINNNLQKMIQENSVKRLSSTFQERKSSVINVEDPAQENEEQDFEDNNQDLQIEYVDNVVKLSNPLNFIEINTTMEYLKNISDQKQLYDFFNKNLFTEKVLARQKSSNLSQQDLQQLLCGWVLYYRIFVEKYNELIQDIAFRSLQNNMGQQQPMIKFSSRNQKYRNQKHLIKNKPKALEYIKNCIKAFENAGNYYALISGNKLAEDQLTAWTGQYLIYGKLAKISWLNIIKNALIDEHFENYSNSDLICEFHLCSLFNGEKNEDKQKLVKLKQLHKYFSKKKMSQMICYNSLIMKHYLQESPKVKAFFGYNVINMDQDKEFVKEMQFRNAFIEAQYGKPMIVSARQ